MRFYLDQNVDIRCRNVLVDAGHQCWTASEAGLSLASDDEQTVYAHHQGAVLITHDREFTERRKRNAIGHHVRLVCEQPDGPDLLAHALDEAILILERRQDVTIEIRPDGLHTFHRWD